MFTISSIREDNRDLLKQLAFEFTVVKMSEWFWEAKHLTTKEEFNDRNTFDHTKLLVYPFFVCIANGSFDTLFELFSPFYALKNGPVSHLSLKLVLENKMKYFSLDNEETFNLRIKEEFVNVGIIKNDIDNTSINTTDGETVMFKNVHFDNASKTIGESISSSLEAIKKQSAGKFITYDNHQIITLARQHKSWSTVYNYYSSIQGAGLSNFVMAKEEASKDRKVYKPMGENYKDPMLQGSV